MSSTAGVPAPRPAAPPAPGDGASTSGGGAATGAATPAATAHSYDPATDFAAVAGYDEFEDVDEATRVLSAYQGYAGPPRTAASAPAPAAGAGDGASADTAAAAAAADPAAAAQAARAGHILWTRAFQVVSQRLAVGDTSVSGTQGNEELADIESEQHSVIDTFTAVAAGEACVVIDEVNLPADSPARTIKPAGAVPVAPSASGAPGGLHRPLGIAGGEKYVTEGMFLKFAVDNNGVYSRAGAVTSDDAAAAKAVGCELRALNAVLSAGASRLHVPLMALITYRGWRVAAASALPLSDGMTHVFGSADGGMTIVEAEHEATRHRQTTPQSLWSEVGSKLNLRSHLVLNNTARAEQAVKDLETRRAALLEAADQAGDSAKSPDVARVDELLAQARAWLEAASATHPAQKVVCHGPGDAEMHQDADGSYFAVDVARLLPPTTPKHPAPAEADTDDVASALPSLHNSFLYMHMRPEFVRRNPRSLSADAFSRWGMHEGARNNALAREATDLLETDIVKEAAAACMEAGDKMFTGTTDQAPANLLHACGVNLRYLSVVRSWCDGEQVRSLLGIEMTCRAAKAVLNARWRRISANPAARGDGGGGDGDGGDNDMSAYHQAAADVFNAVLGSLPPSAPQPAGNGAAPDFSAAHTAWATVIAPTLHAKYRPWLHRERPGTGLPSTLPTGGPPADVLQDLRPTGLLRMLAMVRLSKWTGVVLTDVASDLLIEAFDASRSMRPDSEEYHTSCSVAWMTADHIAKVEPVVKGIRLYGVASSSVATAPPQAAVRSAAWVDTELLAREEAATRACAMFSRIPALASLGAPISTEADEALAARERSEDAASPASTATAGWTAPFDWKAHSAGGSWMSLAVVAVKGANRAAAAAAADAESAGGVSGAGSAAAVLTPRVTHAAAVTAAARLDELSDVQLAAHKYVAAAATLRRACRARVLAFAIQLAKVDGDAAKTLAETGAPAALLWPSLYRLATLHLARPQRPSDLEECAQAFGTLAAAAEEDAGPRHPLTALALRHFGMSKSRLMRLQLQMAYSALSDASAGVDNDGEHARMVEEIQAAPVSEFAEAVGCQDMWRACQMLEELSGPDAQSVAKTDPVLAAWTGVGASASGGASGTGTSSGDGDGSGGDGGDKSSGAVAAGATGAPTPPSAGTSVPKADGSAGAAAGTPAPRIRARGHHTLSMILNRLFVEAGKEVWDLFHDRSRFISQSEPASTEPGAGPPADNGDLCKEMMLCSAGMYQAATQCLTAAPQEAVARVRTQTRAAIGLAVAGFPKEAAMRFAAAYDTYRRVDMAETEAGRPASLPAMAGVLVMLSAMCCHIAGDLEMANARYVQALNFLRARVGRSHPLANYITEKLGLAEAGSPLSLGSPVGLEGGWTDRKGFLVFDQLSQLLAYAEASPDALVAVTHGDAELEAAAVARAADADEVSQLPFAEATKRALAMYESAVSAEGYRAAEAIALEALKPSPVTLPVVNADAARGTDGLRGRKTREDFDDPGADPDGDAAVIAMPTYAATAAEIAAAAQTQEGGAQGLSEFGYMEVVGALVVIGRARFARGEAAEGLGPMLRAMRLCAARNDHIGVAMYANGASSFAKWLALWPLALELADAGAIAFDQVRGREADAATLRRSAATLRYLVTLPGGVPTARAVVMLRGQLIEIPQLLAKTRFAHLVSRPAAVKAAAAGGGDGDGSSATDADGDGADAASGDASTRGRSMSAAQRAESAAAAAGGGSGAGAGAGGDGAGPRAGAAVGDGDGAEDQLSALLAFATELDVPLGSDSIDIGIATARGTAPLAKHLFSKGMSLAAMGRVDAALALAMEAMEVDPNDCSIAYNIAMMAAENGDFVASLAAYDRVMELCPGWYDVRSFHQLTKRVVDGVTPVDLFPYIRACDAGNVAPAEAVPLLTEMMEAHGCGNLAFCHVLLATATRKLVDAGTVTKEHYVSVLEQGIRVARAGGAGGGGDGDGDGDGDGGTLGVAAGAPLGAGPAGDAGALANLLMQMHVATQDMRYAEEVLRMGPEAGLLSYAAAALVAWQEYRKGEDGDAN